MNESDTNRYDRADEKNPGEKIEEVAHEVAARVTAARDFAAANSGHGGSVSAAVTDALRGAPPRRAADPFRNSRNVPMPCVACHTPTDCMAGKVTCALDTVQDSANSAGGPSDGLEPWRDAEKTILEGVHGTRLLEELLRRRLRTMLGAQRPVHGGRHPHEAYMLMLKAGKHLASATAALAEAGDTVAAQ